MDDRLVDLMQARYWLACGELEPVVQWSRKRGLLGKSPAEIFNEAGRNAASNELLHAEYLVLIRLTLAQRLPVQALEMITSLLEVVERRGYQRRIIELLVLKALALQQMEKVEPALLTLESVLSLAEPEAYWRAFVDEGEPMARLLYQAVAHKICPVYAGRLLQALSEENQLVNPPTKSQITGLIETPPDSNTKNIPISSSPAIHVVKSSTTTTVSQPGQVVPYTFTVTNAGNTVLTGITVTDPKCDAAPAYQSGDTNADGELDLTETWIYTCSHTVTQAEINAGGKLSNTATADSIESPPDTSTKNIPISTAPAPSADLSVIKNDGVTTFSAGGSVTYTVTVANAGTSAVVGALVSDTKPVCFN